MKIAIVRLSAIGDIVQSMIVLQFIKKKFPDASIDWFVDNQFATLLDDCIEIDNVIKLDIKKIKQNKSLILLFKTLRKLQTFKKYDYVFDLQGLIKSAVITRFIPSRERIGFDKNSTRERFASHFYSKKYQFPYHENVVMRYINIVASALDICVNEREIKCKKPFFNLPPKKAREDKPKILIVLGASFDSKIYPVDKYAQIVNALQANFVALWHSKKEFEMAKRLQSLSGSLSITKCKNFSELKQLVINSDLVIGGDTGPTHIAWALNIPSVTIFGSTPLERNCFITDKNLAISSGNKVNAYKINKKDFSINLIKPESILSLIKRLL
jgi:heptosyltransferase-1